MPAKSICLVAGEPSGDLQGSLLVSALKERHPEWDLWGVGSQRMAAAGCDLWCDARAWAVMGFSEVLRSLWRFHRRLEALTGAIGRRRPDGVILIDFPGFNLKLARRVHDMGIPVLYYIVPQLWAWGKRRIKVFREAVDRTVVVFPFEREFFAAHDVAVDWIGHPLVDIVRASTSRAALRQQFHVAPAEKLVALMPGVRPQDYRMHLPLFAEVVRRLRDTLPNVRGMVGINAAMGDTPPLPTDDDAVLSATTEVYDLMGAADLVLTKTGTTTVECALLGTPMVTAYRTGPLNFAIARALVDIPFIAMPNLIAKRRVVPEFVQTAAKPEALTAEALTLLTDDAARSRQCEGLAQVRELLGPPGAVTRGADVVDQWLAGRVSPLMPGNGISNESVSPRQAT